MVNIEKDRCERCGKTTTMGLRSKYLDGERYKICHKCLIRVENKQFVREMIAKGHMSMEDVRWETV